MIRIPVYKPALDGNEKRYVLDCLESGWVSSKGSYIARFEEAFGAYLKVPYCSTVSNGTTALQTALGAMGIGPGDEVIVPSLTYIASVNTILATGATPVFADSLRDSWQLDPDDAERLVTARTRAIMPVHLYGGVCAMDRIMDLALRKGLLVIEDCAEAIGSRYDNRLAGSFGDVATFSFYGNKTITTGEGGMVATKCPRLHERMQRYKGQGVSPYKEYWHETLGFNYRMTNICAAIGLAQLERIDAIIARKRCLADWYRLHLKDLPLEIHRQTDKVFHTYWMVSVLFAKTSQRDPIRQALLAEGIETRPLFYPAHTMPVYNHAYRYLPCAEDLSLRGMNLPSWPGLREEDVVFIANVLRKHLGH